MWNTCCHGIGHACIGLLLLHAVTAQDTCARNQIWCKKVWWAYDANGDRIDPAEAPIAFALTRKTHKCKCVNAADINDSGCCVAETVKGRCQKNEFWCKKVFTPSGRHNIPPTHQCDCPGNLDNSGCCVMCGWGQYREGIMEDTACEPCPATTLLTDYKSDKRVRTPCANCGVAFGWVDDYTKKSGWGPNEYAHYTDPFKHYTDPSKNKDLICIKDRKNKCTDTERNLADLMVVSVNSGIRTCGFCHPPTYFFNGKCVRCPVGMQSATPLEDSKLFIPEDVKLANPADGLATSKNNREPDEFPQANFAEFGCRACSVSQGVRDRSHTQCTPCSQYQYQLETREDIQLNLDEAGKAFYKTPIFLGNLKLYLGTSCGTCPPGFEFYNWKNFESGGNPKQGQCRSSNPILDCCRICGINQFSVDGTQCQKVDASKATDKPFGARTEIECVSNKHLVYCNMNGLCSFKQQPGWRTCRPCYGIEDGVFYGNTKNTECKECTKTQYSDKGTCKECRTCEGLLKTDKLADIYEIPENNIYYQHIYRRQLTTELTWKMEIVEAICYELDRRNIEQGTEIIKSVDLYSVAYILNLVPNFHTIVRNNLDCTLKRCDTVCTEFFQHSPGCGQQETRVANIFVNSSTGVIEKYNRQSTYCKNKVCNITHGPCTQCTTCSKGYFNKRCNVYADTHLPAGWCELCKSNCELDQFMYHSHGEGACHNPGLTYTALPSGNNKWKIKEDYVCKKCPTWVFESKTSDNKAATMKTVTACGERPQYITYGWDRASRLQSVSRNVEWSKNQNDVQLGANYKKFRHFHRDLVPYCPEGYYYNARNPNCNIDQDTETYIVPASDNHIITIGFSTYDPTCCEPCTTCTFTQKKNTAHWRACKGDSTEDTQNRCVDRCGAMYYQNETAKTCNACETCQAGLLT